jgi:LysR family transcriptional regulator, nitrogen assimilation regulatory protein
MCPPYIKCRGSQLTSMDLKQLHALMAIAETGSVTRAAEVLHIVQPAVSRQVKLLEEELGVMLFDRERHGMVLTPSGRRFVERARRALDELAQAKAEVRPQSSQIVGSVVVGFLPNAAEQMVGTLMGRVRHNHPRVQLRSYVSYVSDLEAALEKSEIDVALLYLRPDGERRFPYKPLLQECLYLVGPRDAGLDLATPTPISDLAGKSMVLPAPSLNVRSLIDRQLRAAGVDLVIAAETTSISVQKSLVLDGVGMAILSGFVIADEVSRGVLTASPIVNPSIMRTLALGMAAGKVPSTASEEVAEELKHLVYEYVEEGRWPGAQSIHDAE